MRAASSGLVLAVLDAHESGATREGGWALLCFCPRSVMFSLIHLANHPEIDWRAAAGLVLWMRGRGAMIRFQRGDIRLAEEGVG